MIFGRHFKARSQECAVGTLPAKFPHTCIGLFFPFSIMELGEFGVLP